MNVEHYSTEMQRQSHESQERAVQELIEKAANEENGIITFYEAGGTKASLQVREKFAKTGKTLHYPTTIIEYDESVPPGDKITEDAKTVEITPKIPLENLEGYRLIPPRSDVIGTNEGIKSASSLMYKGRKEGAISEEDFRDTRANISLDKVPFLELAARNEKGTLVFSNEIVITETF